MQKNDGHTDWVLRNINHEFPLNQITAIIGPSGAGKTVLCKHLNGLLKPTTGQIQIFNFVISAPARKIKNVLALRKRVGFVFQNSERQLFEETVHKEIIFGPMNFGFKKATALAQGQKHLQNLDFDVDNLSRSPFSFSGGQKRKIALASILAYEPDLIIFDAPTAGLDLSSQEKLLLKMRELKTRFGKTIIFVSRNMNEVLAIADQVLVMEKGTKVGAYSPQKLFHDTAFCQQHNIQLPDTIKFVNKLRRNGFDTSQLDPRSFQTLVTTLTAQLQPKKPLITHE